MKFVAEQTFANKKTKSNTEIHLGEEALSIMNSSIVICTVSLTIAAFISSHVSMRSYAINLLLASETEAHSGFRPHINIMKL